MSSIYTLRVGKSLDARCRLSPVDKADIVRLFEEGVPIMQLTALYHVTYRTIVNILHPEKYVAQLAESRRRAKLSTKCLYGNYAQRLANSRHKERKIDLHNKGLI